MAQKYYNHISLLSPLDWEAPYRASLCGEMGRDMVGEWEHKPRTVFGYYESTIQYLQKIDISEDDKVSAISEASKILLDVLHRYEAVYADPNNKPQLDEFSPGFVPGIRKAYCDMIQLLSKISPSSFDGLIEIELFMSKPPYTW